MRAFEVKHGHPRIIIKHFIQGLIATIVDTLSDGEGSLCINGHIVKEKHSRLVWVRGWRGSAHWSRDTAGKIRETDAWRTLPNSSIATDDIQTIVLRVICAVPIHNKLVLAFQKQFHANINVLGMCGIAVVKLCLIVVQCRDITGRKVERGGTVKLVVRVDLGAENIVQGFEGLVA